jgi:hypothetical protein
VILDYLDLLLKKMQVGDLIFFLGKHEAMTLKQHAGKGITGISRTHNANARYNTGFKRKFYLKNFDINPGCNQISTLYTPA